MDTKSKRFSHSIIIKLITFIVMIACLTGAGKALVDLVVVDDGDIGIVFEDNYFKSESYVMESYELFNHLARLMNDYKNEKNILSGKTISRNELEEETQEFYWDYKESIDSDDLSEKETYENFEKMYNEELAQEKEDLIKRELADYYSLLKQIEQIENPIYYATDGKQVYTNSPGIKQEQFKHFPSYMIFEGSGREFYPKEISESNYINWIYSTVYAQGLDEQAIYIGFPETFLNDKRNEWANNKQAAENVIYSLAYFLIGFIISFIYLLMVTGKKAFRDKKVYLNPIDTLFVDLNLIICGGLVVLYIYLLDVIYYIDISKWVIPMTIPIFIAAFMLFLSLIRHIKNRTFLKHTLIYRFINPIWKFVKDVFDSGSLAVKIVIIVIGYPVLVAGTFFMFPITIGIAAWFALKKVQSFQSIQDGVKRIKDGDSQHKIKVVGNGEFKELATDINTIADGLESAVNNELKSERLKAELITNVSHDIRTPLTSIITYVDLLKTENDPEKIHDYVKVLDQKSKRLKILTDDLFDATKASSGNIPVNFEQIEITSLVTQGLGEVSDQIENTALEFKFNHPDEKLFIMADGKLLWRSIENILSNIFKYSLNGSRVYVNLEDLGSEVLLTFKNISSYELNISADELMERFKRGDESRTTQGSGLGLSITKSLIEMQHGKFVVDIDGDLFKAMIYMPKDLKEI